MKSKLSNLQQRIRNELENRGPFFGFKIGFIVLIGIHLKPIYDNAVIAKEYWQVQYCGGTIEGCKYYVGSTLDYMLRTPSSFDYNMGYSIHHYVIIGCLFGLVLVYLLEINYMLKQAVFKWRT